MAKARAYTMTNDEAKMLPDVVSGMFLINNIPATILFDYGASKSFVSTNFATTLNRPFKKLEISFEVETAIGITTRVQYMVEDCELDIEGNLLPTKLFLVTLGGFDIVLGMDWLYENDAHIICNKKMIQITTPDGSLISVYGDHEESLAKIISMMKA